MAYSAISYTQDGWTVNEKAVPSVTSTYSTGFKNLPIVNFNWSTDFSFVGETANSSGTEKTRTYEYSNPSDSLLDQPSVLQYGAKRIDNVYNSLHKDLGIDGKMLQKSGKQVMVKLEESYKATSADANESIPVKAWLCLTIPTGTPVKADIVNRTVAKLLGACFKTDVNDNTVLIDMVRGDLDILA